MTIKNVLKKRIEKLVDRIENNSIILLYSGNEVTKSEDSTYPFFINRNYNYLTNLTFQSSFLVIYKSKNTHSEYIFINNYSTFCKNFIGKDCREKEILKNGFNKNNIIKVEKPNDFLKNKINENKINKVYLDFKNDIKTKEILTEIGFKNDIKDIYDDIIGLRSVKDNYEIECIKTASKITAKGFLKVIKSLKKVNYEYEVINKFNKEILNEGSHELAFDTIAASGKNAIYLHHPNGISKINKNDLILLDAGSGYKNYCTDVTRTYPKNGKYSKTQKIIYDIVEKCNEYIISLVKPGITLDYLEDKTIEFLTDKCLKNKLINNKNNIGNVYYHKVSHHVGLDIHDPVLKEPLKENNVITVEPGLYFKNLKIGVRVEDTILVTKKGSEVLTKKIAKKSGIIEKLIQKYI